MLSQDLHWLPSVTDLHGSSRHLSNLDRFHYLLSISMSNLLLWLRSLLRSSLSLLSLLLLFHLLHSIPPCLLPVYYLLILMSLHYTTPGLRLLLRSLEVDLYGYSLCLPLVNSLRHLSSTSVAL